MEQLKHNYIIIQAKNVKVDYCDYITQKYIEISILFVQDKFINFKNSILKRVFLLQCTTPLVKSKKKVLSCTASHQ